jgi:sarcosine oxidase
VRTEFAVVGGGITGLSAAWALRRRGREVMVLEQAAAGHARGGSHGACRIFRLGYEDAQYVGLAIRARQAWTELEQACGEQLLHPTAQLTFGPLMRRVHAAMVSAGAPCELLGAAEAARRFPEVACDGDVLFEPASAVIAADRALAALARLTGGQPADAVTVTALTDDGRRVTLSTSSGPVEADRVIVCAGPWSAGLLATAGVTVPASATLEQVAYLAAPVVANSAPQPASELPIFVHYGGEFPYGLPVPGAGLYKIGIHHGGPAVRPDDQDHSPDPALGERIASAARAILPGLDPQPVAVERCVYDNSPDTDFIVDRIGNVVIGCGTSGHGFKFGPLLGEWLSYFATTPAPGSPRPDADAAAPPARFALDRFSRTVPV